MKNPHRGEGESYQLYNQKLGHSSHSLTTIRGLLIGRITVHIRRVARSKERGVPLHRSANQSAGSRRIKKLLARTQWFRGNEQEKGSRPRLTSRQESRKNDLCAVLTWKEAFRRA